MSFPVKKITVVSGDNKKTWEFNAFQVTGNLYVHKQIDYSIGKPTRDRKDVLWTITAQPSGALVWNCSSREQAILLAQAIEERFDFGRSVEEMKKDEVFMSDGLRFIREFVAQAA